MSAAKTGLLRFLAGDDGVTGSAILGDTCAPAPQGLWEAGAHCTAGGPTSEHGQVDGAGQVGVGCQVGDGGPGGVRLTGGQCTSAGNVQKGGLLLSSQVPSARLHWLS